MNPPSSTLENLIAQEDVQPEEIQHARTHLLAEFHLDVLRIYDTFSKEGKKDVLLCKDPDEAVHILRIGERRPTWFFPNGYHGTTFSVPVQTASRGGRIPFEIEAYVSAPFIWETEKEWGRKGQIRLSTFHRLLSVFWEFQHAASSFPLKHHYSETRIRTFLREAKGRVPSEAEPLILRYRDFWNGTYPSKWKFSLDNLLLNPDGTITLIDNVKVGARFFGYDLGWLIWPRWIEMETSFMERVDEHLHYLAQLKHAFLSSIPPGISLPLPGETIMDLILFERLIGSLYDVERQANHFAQWGMLGKAGALRRQAHETFLQNVLRDVMQRLARDSTEA